METTMVTLKINNIPVTVPQGTSVLEAARSAGFNIPTLCFLKDVNEIGACRMCVVDVKEGPRPAKLCARRRISTRFRRRTSTSSATT